MVNKFLIFLIFLSLPLFLYAEKKVIWLEEGEEFSNNFSKNNYISISHDTTRMMLKMLDDVEYEFFSIPIERAERYMKENTTYCISSRIKTAQRQLTLYFSQPVHLYPNLKLYYLSKKHPLPFDVLNQQGKLISLKKLFAYMPELFLTVEKGLSYGEHLDLQIAQSPKRNIHFLDGDDQYLSIANMLLRGRIELALLYPTNYSQLIKEGEITGKLYSVPIDTPNSYILGRVACSKTKLGKKVINKINKVLDKLYLVDEFYQRHLKFLHQDEHNLFNQYFNHVFIERNF